MLRPLHTADVEGDETRQFLRVSAVGGVK